MFVTARDNLFVLLRTAFATFELQVWPTFVDDRPCSLVFGRIIIISKQQTPTFVHVHFGVIFQSRLEIINVFQCSDAGIR